MIDALPKAGVQTDAIQEITTLLADHPHLSQPGFSIDVPAALALPAM